MPLSPSPLNVVKEEGDGVLCPQHCVLVPLAKAAGKQGSVDLLGLGVAVIYRAGRSKVDCRVLGLVGVNLLEDVDLTTEQTEGWMDGREG